MEKINTRNETILASFLAIQLLPNVTWKT